MNVSPRDRGEGRMRLQEPTTEARAESRPTIRDSIRPRSNADASYWSTRGELEVPAWAVPETYLLDARHYVVGAGDTLHAFTLPR
jgi:hypothetical protein